MQSSLDAEVIHFIKKQIKFLDTQIQEVKKEIEKIINENDFLSKNFKLLITVDGISFNVACRILTMLTYETIDDITPKSMVAHAGLTPKAHDSGSNVHSHASISRIGNRDLRKIMYMPALSCICHKNYFSSFYIHLIEQGKPKKVAIVAVMQKMLLTAMGVLKNQEPFDPNWSKKVQEKYQDKLKVALLFRYCLFSFRLLCIPLSAKFKKSFNKLSFILRNCYKIDTKPVLQSNF